MKRCLQAAGFSDLVLWLLRAVIVVFALWGIIATSLNNPYSGREWINLLVFGLAQGSVYALIACGYSQVTWMLSMIDFAHGEYYMVGALTATVFIAAPAGESGFLARRPGLALALITIVAMVIAALVAVATERIAYRRLRNAPRLMLLITAAGAALFWRHFSGGLYGSEVKAFPQVPALAGSIQFLGCELPKSHLASIMIAILMLAGFNIWVMRTKTGKAIRALSWDRDAAALVGIDVDRTVAIAFASGAAMAGAAGVLHALVFGKAHYFMGFLPGIKAFSAAVLGGIGSIPGAAIGGLLIGVFEAAGPGLFLASLGIPAAYQLQDAISLAVLVLVLIFRPQGILGERR
jgi:branched-chain amino acid transport system permease protein